MKEKSGTSLEECVCIVYIYIYLCLRVETTSGDFSPSLDPFSSAHTPTHSLFKIHRIYSDIKLKVFHGKYIYIYTHTHIHTHPFKWDIITFYMYSVYKHAAKLYEVGCQYWHLWISLNKTKWINHSHNHFLTLNCSLYFFLSPIGDIIHTLWSWVLFSVNFYECVFMYK